MTDSYIKPKDSPKVWNHKVFMERLKAAFRKAGLSEPKEAPMRHTNEIGVIFMGKRKPSSDQTNSEKGTS
ncbi:hypothetical protein A3A38_01715 [Candidatus Kaiserbacteria bacterium RIFCSPLOWO2_01_FULL_53_17]|uniref:Uncharacterized protein n=1 Tax=Candidatus Kaiserbacteria bacterium RIFCSPLOWO2_01_FULL_53_17 TaxID=1798511 RepID=A0A1F6EH39_9BACT|nr:MAG: hypothetical protein A3A38_01715 [Candidatus Kaiserbacteria bacterium RIFCSPLOWO2_01_FULL_53_17]